MLKLQNLTKRNELCGQPVDILRAQIQSAEAAGDWPRLALAWDALAHYHWRRGAAADLKLARAVLNGGRELLPVQFIGERVMLTNTLLMIELFARRYEFVIERSPAAIADAEILGDDYLRGQAHFHFADALRREGETDRAIEHFTSAAIFFERAGHKRHFAANDNNLALLYIKIKDFYMADRYLDRAERTLRELGDLSAVGQLYETRAQSALAADNPEAAEAFAEQSLALIPADERRARAETYKTLAQIKQRLGKTGEAEAAYLAGMKLLEEASA